MPDLAVSRVVDVLTSVQTVILPKNPLRRYALIINDGIRDCYLGFSAPAALNSGIRVNNGGGNYEINSTNLFHGEINAMSAAYTKILVTEW